MKYQSLRKPSIISNYQIWFQTYLYVSILLTPSNTNFSTITSHKVYLTNLISPSFEQIRFSFEIANFNLLNKIYCPRKKRMWAIVIEGIARRIVNVYLNKCKIARESLQGACPGYVLFEYYFAEQTSITPVLMMVDAR